MRRGAACAAIALLLGACTSGAGHPIALDGSPRVPDDRGIVTAVSAHRITLDGRDTYEVSPHLQSFSTIDLSTVPLLTTKGQYVQVGLRDTTVVWLARIAQVVRIDGHAAVFYVGHFVRAEGQRLVMRDGTVLFLDAGVAAPPPDRDVTVQIDPEKHAVVKITPR